MLLIYHIVIAWIYNITHRTEKAEAASLKWLLHNDQTHTHTNSTLTLLALSTLSRKGKKASELTETSLSLPTHSLFSASVNNSGTCSNSAFHLIKSSPYEWGQRGKTGFTPSSVLSDTNQNARKNVLGHFS